MQAVLNEFEKHANHMRARARTRLEAVQLRNVVEDRTDREAATAAESLGKRLPSDEFEGDVNMRTLRHLLKMVDENGFERSNHQLKFHAAFERAAARVIYRAEWSTKKPQIMRKWGWSTCPGEVLISTPRRFGKTFRSPLARRVLVAAPAPANTR